MNIRTTTMKKMAFTIFYLLISIEVLSQWIKVPSGTTCNFRSVFFSSVDTGYIAGGDNDHPGTILKTIDGGLTWYIIYSDGPNLYSVHFVNNLTGFVVGEFLTIKKTIDGGQTWFDLPPGIFNYPPLDFNSVYFTDKNNGQIVGQFGTILKTINGGTTWIDKTSDTIEDLTSVFFPNQDTGIAVGTLGKIIRTVNGGNFWGKRWSGTTQSLNAVCFSNNTTGYIAGTSGIILKSTDGGKAWTLVASGTSENLRSVFFPDDNTGYAAGRHGIVIKTTDSGVTWERLSGVPTNHLWSIYFQNAKSGIVVGDSGIILKTWTGGIISFAVTPLDRRVPANAGSTLFLVTSDSTWNVTCDADWCNVTHSGSGTDTIIVNYLQNDLSASRIAHIIVTTPGRLYKVDTVTVTQAGSTIGIEDKKQNEFLVYPRLTDGKIFIEKPEKHVLSELSVCNLNGQILFSQVLTKRYEEIDIGNLQEGIYFIKLVSEKMVQVVKIIKI